MYNEMLDCPVDGNLKISFSNSVLNRSNSGMDMGENTASSCWGYWQDWHYPNTIVQSYPVYIQERALDKGKKAYEIIKILKDKKLVKIEKVSNFIDLMDELIKIL